MATALQELKANTLFCSVCHNIADRDPCPICADGQRDHALICVVEEPLDVQAIERTRAFHGRLSCAAWGHLAHGRQRPRRLKIPELLKRIQQGNPGARWRRARRRRSKKFLLATNPNLEGDATAMYIARLVKPLGVRVTRLAHGLPVGGDLEYADDITLGRALAGRSEM